MTEDVLAPAATAQRRRWLLVALPAVLLLAKAASEVLEAVNSRAAGESSTISIALAGLSFVAASGLIGGRRIGWLLALSIVGWGLVVYLARWWVGTPNFVGMALLTVSAFLITSPEMRRAFADRTSR